MNSQYFDRSTYQPKGRYCHMRKIKKYIIQQKEKLLLVSLMSLLLILQDKLSSLIKKLYIIMVGSKPDPDKQYFIKFLIQIAATVFHQREKPRVNFLSAYMRERKIDAYKIYVGIICMQKLNSNKNYKNIGTEIKKNNLFSNNVYISAKNNTNNTKQIQYLINMLQNCYNNQHFECQKKLCLQQSLSLSLQILDLFCYKLTLYNLISISITEYNKKVLSTRQILKKIKIQPVIIQQQLLCEKHFFIRYQ
eukprot:TRINITY_DN13049_c1_g1_i2.p2 TRINITY_DN13049_c1_g1~~TRINITY_DN13049_c1_g1_i2.p2  ORF type:complete len:249 (+),score=-18.08 TRINITY_DN13049_c1_g1_i2:1247-1993(+)